jgi:hypothetical protein
VQLPFLQWKVTPETVKRVICERLMVLGRS